MHLSDDPLVGAELAGCRIESMLRSDDREALYQAEDVRSGRKVALRVLARSPAQVPSVRERFLRVAGQLATLEHPSILPILAAGEAKGRPYVVHPFVEGRELACLPVDERPLAREQVLALISQLASALDTARFARGLVHGALTPSAVLVSSPAEDLGQVFLSGFGLPRELPPGATLAQAAKLGGLAYLSPEQIEGRPISPRSDVYALGCILFECLTGEAAFQAGTPESLLTAHLHEPPPAVTRLRPDLDVSTDRVLERALATWPEERYSTCSELAASAQTALLPQTAEDEQAPSKTVTAPTRLQASSPPAPARLPSPAGRGGGEPVGAIAPLVQVLETKAKLIGALGLVLVLGAIAAGAVWLVGQGGGTGSAMPAPAASAASSQRPARPRTERMSRTVDDVRFSLAVPTTIPVGGSGWEHGPHPKFGDTRREGSFLVTKDIVGSQGAEVVLFWTAFPGGRRAVLCSDLLARNVGRSTADLAAATSSAPGIEIVKGPSLFPLGGRPAIRIELAVREDRGCDPGYFFTWRPRGPQGVCGGACWLESKAGDTIMMWMVAVSGTFLVLEAEMGGLPSHLLTAVKQEIEEIVESIRFE